MSLLGVVENLKIEEVFVVLPRLCKQHVSIENIEP